MDYNSFPIRILRSAKHILSRPLSRLINKSIEHDTYPSKLKLAKIIPVYKSYDEFDPHIAFIGFQSYFRKNDVPSSKIISWEKWYPSWFTIRFSWKKIEPAILDIAAHQKESNTDRKLYTCSIFFDPQKAFESVDYLILLKKLNHYGIKESLTTGSLHI